METDCFTFFEGKYYFKVNERIIGISNLDIFYQICEIVEISDFDGTFYYFTDSIKLPVKYKKLKENHYLNFSYAYRTEDLLFERKIYSRHIISDKFLDEELFEGGTDDLEIELEVFEIFDDPVEHDSKYNYFAALNFILMIYRFFENNKKYKFIEVKLNKDNLDNYLFLSFKFRKPSIKEIKESLINKTFN